MKRVILTTVGLLALLASSAPAADDPKGIDFFEKNIRPVLVSKCYQCHSASAKELGGELRLDTKEGVLKGGESGLAVVPSKPAESLILQALRHEDGLEMPPKEKLSDSVVADFTKWIEMGAPDPRKKNVSTVGGKINILEARKFWAFQPPKVVAPVAAQNAAWERSEIDKYILAGLEAKGLSPVADADKATLIRRAYFDLIGLPPSPEQIDAFVNSSDPLAFEKLIDELLAMPQFGERWGRHWLDVARYGESTSKERNIPFPYAWRYRDYVYDSVAADKPFDQFVREQVAGDLLPAKNDAQRNEMLTATGLLALGPKSLNQRNAEQFRMDTADEQLDVVSRGVMALSVACARCHDHKFDPIPTADYYAMVGIFRSTDVLGGVKQGNNKAGYAGDFVYLSEPSPKKEIADESTRKELVTLNRQLDTAKEELQKARSELRKKAEAAESNPKKGKAKNAKAAQKQLAKREAAALREHQQKIKELEDKIAALQGGSSGGSGSGIPVMGVRDSNNPEDCRINIRGEVTDLGDSVPRGYVRVLTFPNSPDVVPEQSGRLQLAMWLTSEKNPLTARVAANRVWYHLFGRGIVSTVDNFGALGEKPTHPELLDYLALKFMQDGWSTKKLIREIMLSRTYQLASDHSEANFAVDPGNTLVWRMNRKRLEAEAIRDSILAVSGNLDLK
ncbi:MAG TPA: PSD1 and planctomycete cytochrome C domain-containing protein, partial [Pirellulaceae bacterium]|nr:PSD1 and planctomycete cytochrome C domain-containing protein [Pirellulaceae bacterium]